MTPAFKTWDAPAPGQIMETWQAGRCAICGVRPPHRPRRPALMTDHCHRTGLIRGLLCRNCNTREGWGHDDLWGPWRDGDNVAALLRDFSIYTGFGGETALYRDTALSFYSDEERAEWWCSTVAELNAGGPWPIEAPWTPQANARKASEWDAMTAAINALPSP